MKVSSASLLVCRLTSCSSTHFSPWTPQMPGVGGFLEGGTLQPWDNPDRGAPGKKKGRGSSLLLAVWMLSGLEGPQSPDLVVWRVLTPTPCKNNQSSEGDSGSRWAISLLCSETCLWHTTGREEALLHLKGCCDVHQMWFTSYVQIKPRMFWFTPLVLSLWGYQHTVRQQTEGQKRR